MKLIAIRQQDGSTVIGLVHPEGRVERVLVTVDQAEPGQVGVVAKRIVDAVNACDGISDKTLETLADNGGSSGTLPERIVAWSMFVSRARASANHILQQARRSIQNQGGKL